jgi:hypothetical protein
MFAAMICVCLAAPAPLPPRKVTPLDITKATVMDWCGETCAVQFKADGTYWCHFKGRQWVGTWKIVGREYEQPHLMVEENVLGETGRFSWSVRLQWPRMNKGPNFASGNLIQFWEK